MEQNSEGKLQSLQSGFSHCKSRSVVKLGTERPNLLMKSSYLLKTAQEQE
jgi:hypothetical protein